jgi:hypothetical protein
LRAKPTATGVAGAEHVRLAEPQQQRRDRQHGDGQHQAPAEPLQDPQRGTGLPGGGVDR